MNTIRKDSGLSARQETGRHTRITSNGRYLSRSILFTLLTAVALVGTSCRHDTRGQDRASLQEDNRAGSDSTNQPKVNIQVNRKYDEKGNMVAFDSTYSTYYSNIKGDTSRMDSLMQKFDIWFGHN